MDAFSYLSVLTSIVLGLGVTRLFAGIGSILERRREVRVYWVHLVWAANILIFFILQWWILFRWRTQEEWSFFLFAFLLASPAVSFLLSVMLFPEGGRETDFKQHFFENHRWFFGLASLLPPLDAADTLLKGYEHFREQGTVYVVFLSVVFALTIAGAVTDNERYHKLFSVFFGFYLIAFIVVNLNVLA
jgi:hypothetical protein